MSMEQFPQNNFNKKNDTEQGFFDKAKKTLKKGIIGVGIMAAGAGILKSEDASAKSSRLSENPSQTEAASFGREGKKISYKEFEKISRDRCNEFMQSLSISSDLWHHVRSLPAHSFLKSHEDGSQYNFDKILNSEEYKNLNVAIKGLVEDSGIRPTSGTSFGAESLENYIKEAIQKIVAEENGIISGEEESE